MAAPGRPGCHEGWEPSLASSFSSSSSLGHEGGQQLSLEVVDWHQDTCWLSPRWDKGERSPFVSAAFGGGDLSSSLDTLPGHAVIMGIAQGESPSCSPAVAQDG